MNNYAYLVITLALTFLSGGIVGYFLCRSNMLGMIKGQQAQIDVLKQVLNDSASELNDIRSCITGKRSDKEDRKDG